MKISAIREFEFCSAHKILNHEGKCKYLHGHNYKVKVWIEPFNGLDSLGRVIDFKDIKEKIGLWIDENLDHALLLSGNDLEGIKKANDEGSRFYDLPLNCTAEIMAKDMIVKFSALVNCFDCKVTKLQLWETEKCSVEVTL